MMKFRHFISIDAGILPEAAFEAVCSLAPAGRTRRGFRLTVDSETPDGGEAVRQFVRICEGHGLARRNVSTTKSYGHTADRWYQDERLRAEMLVLLRQKQIQPGAEPERDPQGHLSLPDCPDWDVGSIFPNHIVVSHRVRAALEGPGFLGLRFGKVVVQRETLPLWELQSSVALPKMANTHQFIHPGLREPEPFKGDYSRIVMLDDPPFNRGEIHYRRRDLAGAGHFDVANTFENYMEPHPALVISQRLYQHCLKNGIAFEADPVRIDQE